MTPTEITETVIWTDMMGCHLSASLSTCEFWQCLPTCITNPDPPVLTGHTHNKSAYKVMITDIIRINKWPTWERIPTRILQCNVEVGRGCVSNFNQPDLTEQNASWCPCIKASATAIAALTALHIKWTFITKCLFCQLVATMLRVSEPIQPWVWPDFSGENILSKAQFHNMSSLSHRTHYSLFLCYRKGKGFTMSDLLYKKYLEIWMLLIPTVYLIKSGH